MELIRKKLLQALSNLPSRYKLPLTTEECVNYLTEAYKIETEQRGYKYIPNNEKDLQNVSKWLTEGVRHGLMLYGTVGSGKTTMARSVCRVFNAINETGNSDTTKRFTIASAQEICENVRQNPLWLQNYRRTEFLYIDDLGCEPIEIKDYGNSITPLIDVLYSRYENKLITICTSNLGNDDLATRYGERLADRMKEMFNRIPFTRASYRI